MGDTMLRCPFCESSAFDTIFVYDAPPPGEVSFPLETGQSYHREVVRCVDCGHFLSLNSMDMSGLYTRDYVDATYGGAEGMRRAFERIQGLAPDTSDNNQRVKRFRAFAERRFAGTSPLSPLDVLDVGSGLCVFLARLKAETGWDCTALDVDARQVAHAREAAHVRAVQGAFGAVDNLGRFDAISFNKVLEHVRDPISLLGQATAHLCERGFVYIELPDGEAAATAGPNREEFFIEHHHVFSARSMGLLAKRAGFHVIERESLVEPSGKYTLAGFLERLPEEGHG